MLLVGAVANLALLRFVKTIAGSELALFAGLDGTRPLLGEIAIGPASDILSVVEWLPRTGVPQHEIGYLYLAVRPIFVPTFSSHRALA
jgi:hypothetical protein